AAEDVGVGVDEAGGADFFGADDIDVGRGEQPFLEGGVGGDGGLPEPAEDEVVVGVAGEFALFALDGAAFLGVLGLAEALAKLGGAGVFLLGEFGAGKGRRGRGEESVEGGGQAVANGAGDLVGGGRPAGAAEAVAGGGVVPMGGRQGLPGLGDRKSTRL